VARLKTRHAKLRPRAVGEDLLPGGTIQFWYNDLDRALENMKKVAAASAEVDLNTGVAAYCVWGRSTT